MQNIRNNSGISSLATNPSNQRWKCTGIYSDWVMCYIMTLQPWRVVKVQVLHASQTAFEIYVCYIINIILLWVTYRCTKANPVLPSAIKSTNSTGLKICRCIALTRKYFNSPPMSVTFSVKEMQSMGFSRVYVEMYPMADFGNWNWQPRNCMISIW